MFLQVSRKKVQSRARPEQALFSLYVHPSPDFKGYKRSSIFFGRSLPSRVKVILPGRFPSARFTEVAEASNVEGGQAVALGLPSPDLTRLTFHPAIYITKNL